MRVLLAALFFTASTVAAWSQRASQERPGDLDRVDLLQVWLEAVDNHQPGANDEAVRRVASWSARESQILRDHAPTIISLIREPDVALFFRTMPGPSGRRQITYYGFELTRLRALAAQQGAVAAADKCPREAPGPGRGMSGANGLLKRAAVFHLDVAAAIATGLVGSTAPSSTRAGNGSFMLKVDDGQSGGVSGAVGHMELGRRLLDQVAEPCSVRPSPARDTWVRDWYAASLAHQLVREQFEVEHVSRALELFRDDPDMLALAGAVHEALAAPLMQAAVGDNRGLRDRLQLRSVAGELGRAEDLLRQAIARNPRHAEARMRLGRVLGLRGSRAEAARELERAVVDAGEDRLLAYYARMLHGRELEATGNRAGARLAYEQAARLFPTAHAPRLALSQLLRTSGDAASAAAILERLVQPGDDPPVDPWWTYHSAAGRSFEGRMRALWTSTPAPVRP